MISSLQIKVLPNGWILLFTVILPYLSFYLSGHVHIFTFSELFVINMFQCQHLPSETERMTITVPKSEIDKANKDRNHKTFSPNFKVNNKHNFFLRNSEIIYKLNIFSVFLQSSFAGNTNIQQNTICSRRQETIEFKFQFGRVKRGQFRQRSVVIR